MKLDNICHKIALKVLGKPGTVVECMKGCDIFEKGKFYTVNGVEEGILNSYLKIENFWKWPIDFRKAIRDKKNSVH